MLSSGFYMNMHRCVRTLTHTRYTHMNTHKNAHTTDTTNKEVEETEPNEVLFKFYPSSTI